MILFQISFSFNASNTNNFLYLWPTSRTSTRVFCIFFVQSQRPSKFCFSLSTNTFCGKSSHFFDFEWKIISKVQFFWKQNKILQLIVCLMNVIISFSINKFIIWIVFHFKERKKSLKLSCLSFKLWEKILNSWVLQVVYLFWFCIWPFSLSFILIHSHSLFLSFSFSFSLSFLFRESNSNLETDLSFCIVKDQDKIQKWSIKFWSVQRWSA